MKLAMTAQDERVRNIACSDILAMSGHQPVKRVVLERPDPVAEEFRDKSTEELRRVVLEKLGYEVPTPPTTETVH